MNPTRRVSRRVVVAVAVGIIGCSAGEDLPRSAAQDEPVVSARFTGSSACAGCHPEQYAAWSGSHHDRAMEIADADSVLGDFDDREVSFGDETFRFFTRDAGYFVRAPGRDGEPADFEIPYTFGVDPLQQYLVRLPGGRLQALSVAWDSRPAERGGQRWFHLYPDERARPGDPLHWTGYYQTWNTSCAECHSTNLEKRFDPETDSYATTWDEIDVACEACHGPAANHVEWASATADGNESTDPRPHFAVDFAAGDSRFEVDACARCHARRHRVSAEDRRGRPFLDDFMPALLRPGLYHADGQILDEVYVYGSFLQSRMYAQGVRCSDCHDPHSLALRAEGNALCVRCHQQKPDPVFPTLRSANYDSVGHHHHRPGSPGAQCVSCHMPTRTYMQVDARRDHSFRVPRPDLSTRLATPNACNHCHTDHTPEWAAEAVTDWVGPERALHYGELIAAARRGSPEAVSDLAAFAADTTQPAIVRATALELLSAYGPAALAAATAAVEDSEPLVRAVAVRTLEGLPSERRIATAAPLLADPIRAVRSEAARVLSSVPAELLSDPLRDRLEAALAEYIETQEAQLDVPVAHLNLAVLDTNAGRPERAVKRYRSALEIEPSFMPARANLAVLHSQLGRNADAERVLREGIARATGAEEGELHYSLGLLLAEEDRLEAAAGHIGRAAELLPARARVSYNHGLALQRVGRPAEAEAALSRAHTLAPRDPEITYGLTAFYMQQGQWKAALPLAEQLLVSTGGAPEARQVMQRIQRELSAAALSR